MRGPYPRCVKPFLLLATRAEDAAADEEYAAFLRFSGLPPTTWSGTGWNGTRWAGWTWTGGPD